MSLSMDEVYFLGLIGVWFAGALFVYYQRRNGVSAKDAGGDFAVALACGTIWPLLIIGMSIMCVIGLLYAAILLLMKVIPPKPTPQDATE